MYPKEKEAYALLVLQWQVTKPIVKLPRLSHVLWSSLLRFAYRPFLGKGERFCGLGLTIEPGDRYRSRFEGGESLELGVKLPESELARFVKVVANLRQAKGMHGHFQPGKNLKLLAIRCRVTGKTWPQHRAQLVDGDSFLDAALALTRRKRFHLNIITPLRLFKPKQAQMKGVKQVDAPWLLESKEGLAHLLKTVLPAPAIQNLKVLDVKGFWMDLRYRRGDWENKGQSGLMGSVAIEGSLGLEAALRLVWRQFVGFGDGRSFGCGQFRIPEVSALLPVQALKPSRSIWQSVCRTAANHWQQPSAFATPSGSGGGPGDAAMMTDAWVHELAVRQLRQAVYRAMGTPRCGALRQGDPPDLHALAINVAISWCQVEFQIWMSFLQAVFPNEPLVGRLAHWLEQKEPVDCRPLLQALWHGVVRFHFAPLTVMLPGADWDLALVMGKAEQENELLESLGRLVQQLHLPISGLQTQVLHLPSWFAAQKAA